MDTKNAMTASQMVAANKKKNQQSQLAEGQPVATGFVKRMYDWMLKWADTPYGLPALAVISFLESSIFPIPPDVLLVALVLGAPTRWFRMALVCTVASVLGGMAGYGIGMFFWQSMGVFIVEQLAHIPLTEVSGRMDIALPQYMVQSFGEYLGGSYLFEVYDKWNAWIVFIFGLTPLPYKLITVTAGVAQVNFGVFIVASVLARAARFFAVAYILRLVGEPAKVFIDRHFNKLSVVFIALLIGGVLLVKLVL